MTDSPTARLVHLAAKLLAGDAGARSLLAPGGDPFEGGAPPQFIRAQHYGLRAQFRITANHSSISPFVWGLSWQGEFPLTCGLPVINQTTLL